MRKLSSVLAAMLLLGGTQLVMAKPVQLALGVEADIKTEVQTDVDKSQATGSVSDEATINANSPAVGQEKSQDRATERKAIDHTNKGKHKSKDKTQSPTSTSSGDSSQY